MTHTHTHTHSPVLFESILHSTRMSTEQHYHRLLLGGDESQHKHVPVATVVALQNSLSQWAVPVEGHFFTLGPHQVVHNVAEQQQQQQHVLTLTKHASRKEGPFRECKSKSRKW